MTLPEKLPEDFIRGIDVLSVDASSIIYLLKVGILGFVAAEIKLVATEGIIEEVDWPHLPIEVFPVTDKTLSNDETVVELAVKKRIAVLSEDARVLANAGRNNLNYYNSLMILNYLLLKKRIEKKEYDLYLNRLIEISHYSQEILEYGSCIKSLIDQKLESPL